MLVSAVNNANFQAKLDYSRVRNNPNRWEKVAQSFSEQTRRYKESFIEVYETPEHIILNVFKDLKSGLDGILYAKLNKKEANLLLKMRDPSTIASKIANLLKLGINAEKDLNQADKFATKMATKVKSEAEKNMIYDHFYGQAYTLTRNEILRETMNDEITKNWRVII